jgi:phosphoribosyl 1,2-cyclic phosphate phosphodiesterase
VRARAAGGKNFRSRASLQIDDIFKIDLPPDTYYHMVRNGLDLSALAHLFITHSHSDHFAPTELEFLAEPFAHNLKNAPVRIYGNPSVTEILHGYPWECRMPVEIVTLDPFVPIKAGDLTFTPIVATHMPNEQCLNYVIQSGSVTVLYASDTGVYQCGETVDFLSSLKFDHLIVECTLGTLDFLPKGHMTFQAVLDLREKLAKSGAVTSGTPLTITHFSHNIGLMHEELEAIADPEGIQVAYDGMTIEL